MKGGWRGRNTKRLPGWGSRCTTTNNIFLLLFVEFRNKTKQNKQPSPLPSAGELQGCSAPQTKLLLSPRNSKETEFATEEREASLPDDQDTGQVK